MAQLLHLTKRNKLKELIKIKKMKKQLILAITLFVTVFSFAQKKEMKTLVKAVKNSNYAEAKTTLSQLEPMLSSMDDKTKAKYYLNKGKAFFANGAGSVDDVMVAVESLGKISGGSLAGEVSDLKKLYPEKSN